MVVVQTEVTDEEARRLEEMARDRSVPVPDLIHEAVKQLVGTGGLLAKDERRRRAAAAIGSIDFGDVTDLAENHDKYLAEAYES